MFFYSDNTASACPEILAAIAAANEGFARSYGEDAWSARLNEVFGTFFGADLRAFPVITGTAANALSLATLASPYTMIFAHEQAHVFRDESGAPEFFSGGARLVPVPGEHGRITVKALDMALRMSAASLQPALLSITQGTEFGTVYRPAEIQALCALAHERGLEVHMDGARLANALAFLGCHPGDVTWRAGVDVLSFGATKNGALAAEAVVFFDRNLVLDFDLRRIRGGHLLSKSRYVSAQLLAYVESSVWRRNAQRANAGAARLAERAAEYLSHPVESNQLFLRLGATRKQALRDAGFEFCDWEASGPGEARFVVSWNQPESDIDALGAALSAL
ncbi:MAG: low specificity L-threonine aldolase [Proteobacteria bacterium]|nr:low specificity L-threonine aldolase [Pseudomonadota bacterium]